MAEPHVALDALKDAIIARSASSSEPLSPEERAVYALLTMPTAAQKACTPEQLEAIVSAVAAAIRASLPQQTAEPVAWACTKCNSPRSVDPCPKCGTPLVKPAKGWEWPRLPDIDRIRALAREVGYAVGVHGSLERDLDLIAAPWVAEAVEPMALAEHIAAGLGGRVVDFERQDKPCGRWSCNIHTPDWTKMIDLSVMPAQLRPKALTWCAIGDQWQADTSIGWYSIRPGDDPDFAADLFLSAAPVASYATEAQAKAAAQADYEQRVLAALEPRASDRERTIGECAKAGWDACRKSIYAVCEDVQTQAADPNKVSLARTPDQKIHEKGFWLGYSDAAKSIARGFNAMEAPDDDNFATAIRKLSEVSHE